MTSWNHQQDMCKEVRDLKNFSTWPNWWNRRKTTPPVIVSPDQRAKIADMFARQRMDSQAISIALEIPEFQVEREIHWAKNTGA